MSTLRELKIYEALAEFVNGEDVLCIDVENSRVLYLDEALDGLRFLIDEKDEAPQPKPQPEPKAEDEKKKLTAEPVRKTGREPKIQDIDSFIALAAADWTVNNLAVEFGVSKATAYEYKKRYGAEIERARAARQSRKQNEFEEV